MSGRATDSEHVRIDGLVLATGMCLGGHLVSLYWSSGCPELLIESRSHRRSVYVSDIATEQMVDLCRPSSFLLTSLVDPQAAFDPRVKASFCWFGTDIHSATLGKGKSDDSLARVKKGDMTGSELVVCHMLKLLHTLYR